METFITAIGKASHSSVSRLSINILTFTTNERTYSVSAAPKPKARINLRSKSFWLISIFIVYSLFGWVFVPMILDAQLKSILKSSAKWDTDIERILFNPYALSLELKGAAVLEESQNPVLNFERLYINFDLLQSLGGTIAFDEITLDSPVIHVDLDQQGSTNFQRAFASDTPDERSTETPDTEEPGEPLALFFDRIAISEGAVYFTDRSTGTAHELVLMPLSLSLEEFSTDHNQGGDYSLAISLGQGQSLTWQGQIGIAPFHSEGRIVLGNINASTFWHYVKDVSPYWLNQASVSIEGDYYIENQPDGLQLKVENTALQVDELALSETAGSEQWLSLKQLKLTPVSFDLQASSLDLGQISLDQPVLSIVRAEDQSLNILRPLGTTDSTDSAVPEQETSEQADNTPSETLAQTGEAEQGSSSQAGFQWRLSDIRLSKGSVHWHDQALSTPAQVSLEQLTIEMGAMSQDLSKPFPFDIRFRLVDTGIAEKKDEVETADPAKDEEHVIHLHGKLSPTPFTLLGKANLPGIDLKLAQPYLNETTNIAIENGLISLQSEYDLALKDSLSGSLQSDLRIEQLALNDKILNKPLSSFNLLEVGPLDVRLPDNQQAASIRIGKILLDQFDASLLVAEDGQMNLSHLTKTSTEQENTDAASEALGETEQALSEQQKVDFVLNTFTLQQAAISYTDATLTPAFNTRISELSGSIEDLSSSPETQSKVDLSGKLDSLGKIAIKGTLNPLSDTPNSHIFVQVNNVDLTMASPYAAKYAGYLIDKGKLELDLDYLIDGSKIKASNEVILNQFEFGKSVKSEHATKLPLPLAIGILKDRKGVIDLDLPISGDLNDPSFQIGSVLLNTFVNVITKVVTSPFSILGGLIEGGDKLSQVSFQANVSELEPEQMQSVLTLAKALQERPKLSLEIRGVADANIDQVAGQPRSEAELINLAKLRAQTLSQLVIEQGDIDSKRVFIQEPEIVSLKPPAEQPASTAPEYSSADSVTAKFTLGVR